MADPAFARILTGDLPIPQPDPGAYLRADTAQPSLPPIDLDAILADLLSAVAARMMGGFRVGPQPQSAVGTRQQVVPIPSAPSTPSVPSVGGLGPEYYAAGGGWYM
jgi:hypothetical protein